jgi:hypothetical protein
VLASSAREVPVASIPLARRPSPPAALVGLAVLVALARSAAAQDAQYWDIQYGPVGQLLGGQVVGSSRDLSATYYNPGGLALGEDPDFLLSVQAFRRQNLTVKPVEGGEFLDFSHTEWGTFPGFVAFAFPDSWLGTRTRLAFSLLTRQEAVQRIDQRFAGSTPAGGGRYGLETLYDQRMNEQWGGLTLSRRLGDRWGLGATLYGVYRGQRVRREQSLQTAYPGGEGVSALVVDDFDYDHWRLLGKVGVAWEGDSLRVGATVTTPSAGVMGTGSLGFTRSANGIDTNGDGRPESLLANGLDEDVDSAHHSSWAFAGGGAWRRGSLQVHVTAEYFAPVDRFTVLQGESVLPGGDVPGVTQELEGVLNAGAGVEYWLKGRTTDRGPQERGTVLYAAFATDHAASPDVEATEASTSNQDHYHLTAGAAFSVRSSRFSLGLTYTFGSKRRHIGLGGLPPEVPIIAEGVEVDVRYSRIVFVLGYLFAE